MNTLWQDLRYGVRMFMKKPGFTAVAALTLALGIGANTAIFSVVYSVILRPLPYQQPDRLVMIWEQETRNGRDYPTSPATFLDWRERNGVFEDVAAYEDGAISKRARFFLTGGNEPERIWGARVSVNLFSLLGVRMALGRGFLPEEEEPGREQVAVLSDGLWRRRFGADPELIGKTIRLNDQNYTVVGVAPPGFKFTYPKATDLWTALPMGPRERANRGEVAYKVVSRLKPGVALEQAQVGMSNLMRAMEREHPKAYRNTVARLAPLHEDLFGATRRPLSILFGAVGFVLLIACVNVSNLLLARAAGRTREIAVRAALGASRFRLVRQLLVESVLLSLIGGALGLLLSLWGRDLILRLMPATAPRGDEIMIDHWVLGFTMLLSMTAGILFGLAPAMQSSKPDLIESLKAGAKIATADPRARRMRNLLVISEVALALVLLAGAGLRIRSLWRLRQVGLGFNPNNLLAMQFTIPRHKIKDKFYESDFTKRALGRIKSLPGVAHAASSSSIPLRGVDYHMGDVEIVGGPRNAPSKIRNSKWRVVSPDFFRTMEIRLIKGRFFTEGDVRTALKVAIISEALARQYFPNEEPLGQRLMIHENDPSEIVGVVADARYTDPTRPVEPAMYEPLDQQSVDPTVLVARATADAMNLAPAIKQAIWAEDKDQPVENIATMEQIVAASIADTRFYSSVLLVFALSALALGATGIYGVVSYGVAQRTHEIGVRLALGANQRDIFRLVAQQGMITVVIGVIIGLAASLALTRVMKTLLFGVSATDPMTFAAIAVLLTGVALLACWIPARRATKVDPIIALRYE